MMSRSKVEFFDYRPALDLAEYSPNWREAKDFVLRLATARQAQSLVDRLCAWASSKPQPEAESPS